MLSGYKHRKEHAQWNQNHKYAHRYGENMCGLGRMLDSVFWTDKQNQCSSEED